MKKILSFFVFAAIMITFAACNPGENEPQIPVEPEDPVEPVEPTDPVEPTVKGFTFKAEASFNKAHCVVRATKKDTYFYCNSTDYMDGYENTLRQRVEDKFKDYTYQQLVDEHNLVLSKWERFYQFPEPESAHIVYACYIEEDEETGNWKIVGDIEYIIFKIMPEHTLGGEFSVSKTRKVHFAQSNVKKESNGANAWFDFQFDYIGSATEATKDLFPWDVTQEEFSETYGTFFVLSKDEWWYLFRERPNAEKLFAHATITFLDWPTHGLLILPDNWETPDDIILKSDYLLGIRWDGQDTYTSSDETYDGYAHNVISYDTWRNHLEPAGAVFLPATWNNNASGWYWSSTADGEDDAYEFSFGKNTLTLTHLISSYTKQSNATIRPVRVVK